MIVRIEDAGADIQRFCGHPQCLGQLLQHLSRGLAEASLDLAQVWIGDAGLFCELTQRQLRRPALTGNELTEGANLARDLIG